MKYLIITYDDYFNIPYIKYYEEHLRKSEQYYDIVLWNRSGRTTPEMPNAFLFQGRDHPTKLGKVLPFLQWRSFVIQILRRNRYDRLIVLTTAPAILLGKILFRDYSGRYWLDIRDYTYEHVLPYRILEAAIIKHSSVTSISSKAFREFLPNGFPAILVHNITNITSARSRCTLDAGKRPITIGYVGGIQYFEENQRLIRLFQNNPDYQLKYVGNVHPSCDLVRFCQEQRVNNVQFYPAFDNDEKPRIYESIDFINCVYGANTKVVQLALPNKLYDSILYKKPMLVSKGTYLAQIVEQYHLGLAVDIETDPVVEMINDYLENFDQIVFEKGCEAFLQIVLQEQANFDDTLERFCSKSIPHAPAAQSGYTESVL